MADQPTAPPSTAPATPATTPPIGAKPAAASPPAASPAPAAPVPAAPSAPVPEPPASSRGAAAKGAAKHAAKAGLKAFQNAGAGMATGAKGFFVSVATLPLLLFRGSLSTRLLMTGFLASLVVLAMSSVQLYRHYVADWAKHKAAEVDSGAASGMNDFFKQQKELSIAAHNVVFLERFSGSLRSEAGNAQVFEIEIYLEASDPETAGALKARLEGVREIVAAAIQGQVYETLMTEEGKAVLKRHIAEAITRGLRKWKSGGTVRRVFFTRFVMG